MLNFTPHIWTKKKKRYACVKQRFSLIKVRFKEVISLVTKWTAAGTEVRLGWNYLKVYKND